MVLQAKSSHHSQMYTLFLISKLILCFLVSFLQAFAAMTVLHQQIGVIEIRKQLFLMSVVPVLILNVKLFFSFFFYMSGHANENNPDKSKKQHCKCWSR